MANWLDREDLPLSAMVSIPFWSWVQGRSSGGLWGPFQQSSVHPPFSLVPPDSGVRKKDHQEAWARRCLFIGAGAVPEDMGPSSGPSPSTTSSCGVYSVPRVPLPSASVTSGRGRQGHPPQPVAVGAHAGSAQQLSPAPPSYTEWPGPVSGH